MDQPALNLAPSPLSLRVPAELRERLEALAQAHGRSLNQEVVRRLQQSCWPAGGGPLQKALEVIGLPKVVRLRSGSTSTDAANVVAVADGLGVDRVLFAARPNDLNGATLVLILESSFTTVLLDGSWINMAREPRIGEVEQMLQDLDARRLLQNARYCQDLVEDTTALEPADAVNQIIATGRPAPLDLRAYLDLLSVHGLYDIKRCRLQPGN